MDTQLELKDARPWGGPFAMVTLAELDTPEWRGLTRAAMLLLLNLLAECRGRKGWCMSSTVLNKRTGLSGRSHYRSVAELVEVGLIATQRRKRPDGGTAANAFTILVPPSLRPGLSIALVPSLSGGPPDTDVRSSHTFMNSQTMNPPTPRGGARRKVKGSRAEVRKAKLAALASWMVCSWPWPAQTPTDTLQLWKEQGYPLTAQLVSSAQGVLGLQGWPRMRGRTVAALLQAIAERGPECHCGQHHLSGAVLCSACVEELGAVA